MLRRSEKQAKPIPVDGSIGELLERIPGLDALDLATFANTTAAAHVDITRLTSLAFALPEGRLTDANLRASSAPSTLRVEENVACLGAANPAGWHSEWTLFLEIAGATATIEYGESLKWGRLALNNPARTSFVLQLETALKRGLHVESDQDDARLANALVWDEGPPPLEGNGTEDGYLVVPEWFTHGASIDLPEGSGARLLESPALDLLVARRSANRPGRLTIHLDGGRAGQRSALVVDGDKVTLDAPDWAGRVESARQQTARAAMGVLMDLALALSPPHPELAAALGAWQAAIVARYQGARGPLTVPALAADRDTAVLPCVPGTPIPVGLVVSPPDGVDLDIARLERLVPIATRWTTLRLTRWQWTTSSDGEVSEVDYYTGPYRRVHDLEPSPWIDYGDAANGSPTGAIDLEPSLRRPAWRAGWSAAAGQWLVTAQTFTKVGTVLAYGSEYVAFLQALTWLVREAVPDARVAHLWLTP